MSAIVTFVRSNIGKKILMALSGLALIGFLLAHLAGNLLIFKDATTFNNYSHALVTNPLIELAEIILLTFFLVHAVLGIVVTIKNRVARPQNYNRKDRAHHTSRKSTASSSMIVSGLFLLVFIVVHILTFKFGTYYESAAEAGVRDIHRLVVESFQDPLYTLFYVVALLLMGTHLWHAFFSAFESLGLAHRPGVLLFGRLLAFVLSAGFIAIPVYLYLTGGQL